MKIPAICMLLLLALSAAGSANSLVFGGSNGSLTDIALSGMDRGTLSVKLPEIGWFESVTPASVPASWFFTGPSASILAELSETRNAGNTIAYGWTPAYGSTPLNGVLGDKPGYGGGTFPPPDFDGPAGTPGMSFGSKPAVPYTGNDGEPPPPGSEAFSFNLGDGEGARPLSTLDFWDVTLRNGTPPVEANAITAVPEPATMILIGGGLIAIAAGAKRHFSKR